MQAMIFAAGLGTRLRPLTENKPKALVKFKGKPLLQYVIENLKSYGFTKIVINVHHFADQIKQFLIDKKNFGLNITISDETDQLLDTGGGLYKARNLFSATEPILLHNTDILTSLNLAKFYNSLEKDAIAKLATQKRTASRVLIFSQQDKILCGWRNKKTYETITARSICSKPIELAFSGIHIISPKIFNLLWPGKYSIITAYLKIAQAHKITFYDHSGDFWQDMGKPEAFS